MDSTNIRPPDFGPGFALYPELPQLVRVTGPALVGTLPPAYPALVQQYRGNLQVGDREPCYVIEPNRIFLGPGIYDCRLVGNYLNLPLFATTCCSSGSSSSSSSSASGAGPTIISTLSLGKTQGTGITTLNLIGIKTTPGTLLITIIGVIGSGAVPTIFYGAVPLAIDATAPMPVGSPVTGNIFGTSTSSTGSTNDITVTVGAASSLSIQAIQVTGLIGNVLDKISTAKDLAAEPTTGVVGTTTYPNEYAQAGFALAVPGGSWTWENGFASGGQDISETVGITAVSITEGRKILSAIGTIEAILSGITPAAFAGFLATYK